MAASEIAELRSQAEGAAAEAAALARKLKDAEQATERAEKQAASDKDRLEAKTQNQRQVIAP